MKSLFAIAAVFVVGVGIFYGVKLYRPDLVIIDVRSTPYGQYSITIQNQGLRDVSKRFYLCEWSDDYRERKQDECNGTTVVFDLERNQPIALSRGATTTVEWWRGAYGGNRYFAVDRGNDANTDNLVRESDERNNTFVVPQP